MRCLERIVQRRVVDGFRRALFEQICDCTRRCEPCSELLLQHWRVLQGKDACIQEFGFGAPQRLQPFVFRLLLLLKFHHALDRAQNVQRAARRVLEVSERLIDGQLSCACVTHFE